MREFGFDMAGMSQIFVLSQIEHTKKNTQSHYHLKLDNCCEGQLFNLEFQVDKV